MLLAGHIASLAPHLDFPDSSLFEVIEFIHRYIFVYANRTKQTPSRTVLDLTRMALARFR